MTVWIKQLIFLFIINLTFGCYDMVCGQSTQQEVDSTKNMVSTDSLSITSNVMNDTGEIELLEINIEAVIEKPRVAILPKRVEPKLGEMEFVDRSFERELKKAPDNPMIWDNRLFIPKKIEDLKQKLIQKQNEQNKNK